MQKIVCSYTQILQGENLFNNLLLHLLKVVFLGFTHLTSSRCGLTLTLSTNLVLWMAAVAEESVHQTEVPLLNISYKTYRGTQTQALSLTDCRGLPP